MSSGPCGWPPSGLHYSPSDLLYFSDAVAPDEPGSARRRAPRRVARRARGAARGSPRARSRDRRDQRQGGGDAVVLLLLLPDQGGGGGGAAFRHLRRVARRDLGVARAGGPAAARADPERDPVHHRPL